MATESHACENCRKPFDRVVMKCLSRRRRTCSAECARARRNIFNGSDGPMFSRDSKTDVGGNQ